MHPTTSPEVLMAEAIGALDEAFSLLCKLRNVAEDPVLSVVMRRTLKSIESLEEVSL